MREFLIRTAHHKGLVSYTEAGDLIGLDMTSDKGKREMDQILEKIYRDEISKGHPMLSALVIKSKKKMRPNSAFYERARPSMQSKL